MSLNPRAIATLGIGFSVIVSAHLGLWPAADAPTVISSSGPSPSSAGFVPHATLDLKLIERENDDLEDMAVIFEVFRSVQNG